MAPPYFQLSCKLGPCGEIPEVMLRCHRLCHWDTSAQPAWEEGKPRLASILQGTQTFRYFSSTCCHGCSVSREKTQHILKACLWGIVLAESLSSKSQRRWAVNPEDGSKKVVQFSSVLSHVRLFATPGTIARQASLHHHLPELTQTHVH